MNSPGQKKTILITVSSLKKDPGGVSSYYNSVLPHMYESDQFTINIFEVGSFHGKNKLFHQIMDQIKFFLKILSVKPDVVHVNPSLNLKGFIREGLLILSAKRKNTQVFVFFRGWDKQFAKKIDKIYRFFFNLTYKKADVFIVLASEFKQKLYFWGIKKPVFLLTTAFDENLITYFSIQKKIEQIKKSKNIRILFLSRLEKKKGVFETIDAFRLLLAKNYNVTLSIAGDGNLTRKIYKYLSQYGLENKVSMLGYVSGNSKIDVLSKHDIYCFPTSYGEGMSNSLLEAMAFGLAVVTTSAGGIKDFFENGKMGYLCNTDHPEEISEMIEKFIYSKDLLSETAFYNHNYAVKHFTSSSAAQNLLDIYSYNLKNIK